MGEGRIKRTLGYQELKRILPQAYPFLLIDRVVDFIPNEKLVAVKNITANEWPLEDRAAANSYFPQTLLIEAAAQAALILYHVSLVKADSARRQYTLGKIKAEFLGSVESGDQLEVEAFATKLMESGGYSEIVLRIGPKEVLNCEVMYSVQEIYDDKKNR